MTIKKWEWKRWTIYAMRHALGGSLAIFTASILGLQFASQAGGICIFSMLSTSKDTMKLTISRVLSFIVTAICSYFLFTYLKSAYIAFGLFIFITIVVSEMMGWGAALSANVVAGTHFLSVEHFTVDVIINEFYIVIIGMVFALMFNLIRDTSTQREELDEGIGLVQGKLKDILEHLADYLKTKDQTVWKEINDLEKHLLFYIRRAMEYEGNTFGDEAHYYTGYYEMLKNQTQILHNLHPQMRKIGTMPDQADFVIELINYLGNHVTQMQVPNSEITELQEIFSRLQVEDMPKSREEFENRAILYHIITALDDFLMIKWKYLVM